MAKSDSKRKTHSDKFPHTLHKTGQYYKKIKGKLYYFGTDKRAALNRYLEQAAYLHIGKLPRPKSTGNILSKKPDAICNLELSISNFRPKPGRLALFGFVFSPSQSMKFFINPFHIRPCTIFALLQIGFVFSNCLP